MATMVLDAHALMVLFNDEPGADEVEKILLKAEKGNPRLLMSVVNWGEIYYSIMRGASQEMADLKSHEIAGMPVEMVPVDARDLDLVRQAAMFKATQKMSYADCFAAALAKINDAELMTGDRDFKALEGEINISWLKGRGTR
jgi:predicted nucleic acid-binding protein